MRQFVVVAFVALVPISQAIAAPRPVVSVIPVPSWTGYYAGVNVGYGWGSSDSKVVGTGTSVSFPGALPITNTTTFGGAHNQGGRGGVIGGAQAGYNFQYNPKWVFGFEADFQGADQRHNSTLGDSLAGVICTAAAVGPVCLTNTPLSGTAVTGYQAKIDWFGTVRGRVGWLVTDQTLVYATGGLAYGHVGVSGNLTVAGSLPVGGVTFGPNPTAFSASKTALGFAVGAGIEGKFAAWLPQNWSWKLEYLYLDLPFNVVVPFVAASNNPAITNITGTATYRSHFTDNIVRVGASYKFN